MNPLTLVFCQLLFLAEKQKQKKNEIDKFENDLPFTHNINISSQFAVADPWFPVGDANPIGVDEVWSSDFSETYVGGAPWIHQWCCLLLRNIPSFLFHHLTYDLC